MSQEDLFEFRPLMWHAPRRRRINDGTFTNKTAAALDAYAPSSWSRKGTPAQFRGRTPGLGGPVQRRYAQEIVSPYPPTTYGDSE